VSRKRKNWCQNEVDKETKGADSRDKVKHNGRSDQLFLERTMKVDERNEGLNGAYELRAKKNKLRYPKTFQSLTVKTERFRKTFYAILFKSLPNNI